MARQIRTAPLWALRTRNRLIHDGLSFTKQEAIARHAGQASPETPRTGQASKTITWRAASPLRSRSNASFTPSRPIRAEIISSSRRRPSR